MGKNMVSAQPLNKRKKTKKRSKKFKRFQSNRFVRVAESWRRPRGIDSRVRRNFKGTIPMVNIGYGNDERTRHVLPNGLKLLRVYNVKELEILLMHSRTFCAEIPHNVSFRKRKAIVERADELKIVFLNRNGKVDHEDAE